MEILVNKTKLQPFVKEIGISPNIYIDDIDENTAIYFIDEGNLLRDIKTKLDGEGLSRESNARIKKLGELFRKFDFNEALDNELLLLVSCIASEIGAHHDIYGNRYFHDSVSLNLLKTCRMLEEIKDKRLSIEVKEVNGNEVAVFDNLEHYFSINEHIIKPISKIFSLNTLADPDALRAIGVYTSKTHQKLLSEKIKISDIDKMLNNVEHQMKADIKKVEEEILIRGAFVLSKYLGLPDSGIPKKQDKLFGKKHLELTYRIFLLMGWKKGSYSLAVYKQFDHSLRSHIAKPGF